MSKNQICDNLSFILGGSSTNDNPEEPRIREFILNPEGKSFVCILHEYLQRVFKTQPQYCYTELGKLSNSYRP